MVGVINPNSTHTLSKQIESAKASKMQFAPAEAPPSEGESTSTPTPAAHPASHGGSHGLPTGAIVGIVVGGVTFLGVCAALLFFIGRHKSLKDAAKTKEEGSVTKPVGVGGGDPGPGHPGHMSMASYPPQSPHGLYPHPPQGGYPQSPQGQYAQDFGSPLPAYASPQMSHVGLHRPQTGYHQ
jgi:hypothetical protein